MVQSFFFFFCCAVLYDFMFWNKGNSKLKQNNFQHLETLKELLWNCISEAFYFNLTVLLEFIYAFYLNST